MAVTSHFVKSLTFALFFLFLIFSFLGRLPSQIQSCKHHIYGYSCSNSIQQAPAGSVFQTSPLILESSPYLTTSEGLINPAPTPLLDSQHFPKTIWQSTPDIISSETAEWMKTWLVHNPSYRREVLSDSGGDAYVLEKFSHRPDIVELYLNLQIPILKADMLRYLILIADGGIWSDMDVSCSSSIAQWIPSSYQGKVNLVVGQEFDEEWRGEGSDLASQFTNWAIMSKPGSRHLQFVIDEIVADFHKVAEKNNVPFSGIKRSMLPDIVDATGPKKMSVGIVKSLTLMLGEIIDDRNISGLKAPKLVGDVLILPNAAFAAGQGGYPTDQGPTFVTHHYLGTWKHAGKGD